jgi:hypothetical protein
MLLLTTKFEVNANLRSTKRCLGNGASWSRRAVSR